MEQVYLYFFCGLSFVLMGVAVLAQIRSTSSFTESRNVQWIALFGLLHGVSEWLEMFSLLGQDPAILHAEARISSILNALSYILLMAGAVRLLTESIWRLVGGGFVVAWGVVTIWLWLYSAPTSEFDVSNRLLLGAPASLAATVAFARLAVNPDSAMMPGLLQKRGLIAVAMAFGAHTLLTMIAEPSGLFPATHLNEDWFFRTVGLDVHLFRAIAAIAIATALLSVLRQISDARIDGFRQREVYLLEALDKSSMGVSVFALSPFERLYENRTFSDLVGHQIDGDAQVAGPETFVNASDYEQMIRNLKRGIENTNMVSHRVRPSTGETWWSAVSTRRIRFANRDLALVSVLDISDLKQRESELAESALQLRTILESCSTGVCVFRYDSTNHEYLYASNRLLEMFGARNLEELNSFGFLNTFANEKDAIDIRNRHKVGKYKRDAVYERIRLDRSHFWAMGTATGIEFEGQPATIAWVTDVTGRVEAEHKIAQHANQLRSFLESSEAGISVFRRGSLERVYANQGFLRLFGLASHDELNGMDLRKTYVNPEDADFAIDHLMTGAGPSKFVMERQRVDGSKWWARIETKPIEFDGGMATIVWHYDITEQKRGQEELEAGARRIGEILDNSEAGISIFEVETFERRYVNSVFLKMFGAETIKEINAVDFRDTFENRAVAESVIEKLRKGHLMGRRSEMRRRIDGSTWWAVIDAKRIEFDGEPVVITWHYDISEQKQVENELRETVDVLRQTQEELVESEKMASLGGLIAGVAHEINTPVGICLTAASSLEHQVSVLQKDFDRGALTHGRFKSTLETLSSAADLVSRNARRAGALISSFKQVAVDQTSDERRKFMLFDYIEDVLISLGPELSRRKIDYRLKGGDREIELNGYPGTIGQIMTNLSMNAALHAYDAESGGTIEILCEMQAPEDIVITVRDFGKGMDDETRRKMFDPFFTTKRGEGGTGLGMHIVYNLVTQRLGGRISCRSAPGEGTTVELRFPIVCG